jgi:hypothetical protein
MPTYLLYTDETNVEPDQEAEFFIYGGVYFPVERLADLHERIESIRHDAGFLPGDDFKFNTRSRPATVSIADHTNAKNQVLLACADLDVRFVACVILHSISTERTRRWSYQADMVLLAFDTVLHNEAATGLVVFDRADGGFDFAREKFERGVHYEHTGGTYTLRRKAHLFAQGGIGSSHVASVVDIVLGAFRYCINDVAGSPATRAMLPAVMRLMAHRTFRERPIYLDYGLLLRPKRVYTPAYKARYSALKDRLDAVMVEVSGRRALGTVLDVRRELEEAGELS